MCSAIAASHSKARLSRNQRSPTRYLPPAPNPNLVAKSRKHSSRDDRACHSQIRAKICVRAGLNSPTPLRVANRNVHTLTCKGVRQWKAACACADRSHSVTTSPTKLTVSARIIQSQGRETTAQLPCQVRHPIAQDSGVKSTSDCDDFRTYAGHRTSVPIAIPFDHPKTSVRQELTELCFTQEPQCAVANLR